MVMQIYSTLSDGFKYSIQLLESIVTWAPYLERPAPMYLRKGLSTSSQAYKFIFRWPKNFRGGPKGIVVQLSSEKVG